MSCLIWNVSDQTRSLYPITRDYGHRVRDACTRRGRSRSLTQVSRAAAVLLLPAFFVSARNHTSSWNQQKTRTSPTAVALASASEGVARPKFAGTVEIVPGGHG